MELSTLTTHLERALYDVYDLCYLKSRGVWKIIDQFVSVFL